MAGGFVFRLEAVWRVRRRAFEEAQRVVAARLRVIGREQAEVDAARRQMDEQVVSSRDMQSRPRLDVDAIRRHRAYAVFLSRHIVEGVARIGQHERELASERAAMIEAQVAVKAMEKLRERHRERYEAALRRRERAAEDESAANLCRRQAVTG